MLGELGITGTAALNSESTLLRNAIDKVVTAVVDVVDGGSPPNPGALATAWRIIVAEAISVEGVGRAMDLLRAFARERMDALSAGASAIAENVGVLLQEQWVELLYAARYPFVVRAYEAEASKQQSYNAGRALLEQSAYSPRDLSWLRVTATRAACLGLWRDGVAGSELIQWRFWGSAAKAILFRGVAWYVRRTLPLGFTVNRFSPGLERSGT